MPEVHVGGVVVGEEHDLNFELSGVRLGNLNWVEGELRLGNLNWVWVWRENWAVIDGYGGCEAAAVEWNKLRECCHS